MNKDQRGHELVGQKVWIDNNKFSSGSVKQVTVKLVLDKMALVESSTKFQELVYLDDMYDSPEQISEALSILTFRRTVYAQKEILSVSVKIDEDTKFNFDIDNSTKNRFKISPKEIYKFIAEKIVAATQDSIRNGVAFYIYHEKMGSVYWFSIKTDISNVGDLDKQNAQEMFFRILEKKGIEV